jgi:hypothetical protein
MSVLINKDDVLCPDLFFRLKRQFGKVIVVNRGVSLAMRPSTIEGRSQVTSSGEYYRINCPFCNDTRQRLYINHRWFEYRYMANCFNEACTTGELGKLRLDQLHLWLFNTTGQVVLPVHSGKTPDQDMSVLTEMRPPDNCVRISALPSDHEAVKYISSRGYDPLCLEKYLGVGWIDDNATPIMRNRIYIPVYQNDKLYGYQARVIKDDPDRRKQKYVNPVGMRKSRLLYNLDSARHQNVVVICEGPIDVWSVGPSGVAIFGSDCSSHQLEMIGANFNGKLIAVALDGDAICKAESLVHKVQQVAPRSTVVRLNLTGEEDPGMLKSELWRRLHCQLTDMGRSMPEVHVGWPNA